MRDQRNDICKKQIFIIQINKKETKEINNNLRVVFVFWERIVNIKTSLEKLTVIACGVIVTIFTYRNIKIYNTSFPTQRQI